MTIEIIEETIITNREGISTRFAVIAINDGPTVYRLDVGGLSELGDLQPILEAREAELLSVAIAKGQLFDVYDLTPKQVLKNQALVIMDEINILRRAVDPPLPDRTADQIKNAIKNKFLGL